MQKNILWVCFLLAVSVLSVFFIAKAGSATLSYFRLSQRTPITVEGWEVKEIGKDQYVVASKYFFNFSEGKFEGKGQIGSVFPNPWAAEHFLKKHSGQSWSAWFNPKNPNFSALEKHFPYKQVISAGIIILLAVYFSSLGIYMRLKDASR